MTIVGIATAAPGRAGDLVGNWDWPVLLLVPLALVLALLTAEQLRTAEPDRRVLVGGVVTHRQKPATAQGTIFVNLEDETGLVNVICSAGVWDRYRQVARTSPALLVRGTLERVEGVINVVADRLEPLPVPTSSRSRDFR